MNMSQLITVGLITLGIVMCFGLEGVLELNNCQDEGFTNFINALRKINGRERNKF